MNALLPLALIAAVVVFLARRLSFPTQTESLSRGNLPVGREATFLQCAFSMLGKLAAADGEVSEEEEERVRSYIREELELPPKLEDLAMSVYSDALESPLEMRDYVERFRKAFPDSVQHPQRLVELLLDVSCQDGLLHHREEEELYSAALSLGLSKPAIDSLVSKTKSVIH